MQSSADHPADVLKSHMILSTYVLSRTSSLGKLSMGS